MFCYMSDAGNLLPKFMPISFFRRVSRFRGVSGKGLLGNASNFLSRFTGMHLVFVAFQTKVAQFSFCLVRIEMLLLACVLLIFKVWSKRMC